MEKYIKFLKREWANLVFAKKAKWPLKEAVVSFTFDDAPQSAFINGGGMLEKYGYAGTFYIALTFLNKKASTVSFSEKDLQLAIEKRHELACHTYNHIDLAKTKLEESVRDIGHNKAVLKSLFPRQSFQNFSYPFGAKTLAIKKFLSGEFRSARGIGHGINTKKIDLANLKAIKLYRDKFSIEEIKSKIDQAIAQQAWLIFYTHEVEDNPGKYGCTPAYFEAVVKACADKKVKVLTIDKTLDLMEKHSYQNLEN